MPVDLKRLQAVFLKVVEVEETTARSALLEQECGGDAELRERVEALLKAHASPETFSFLPVSPIEDVTKTFVPHVTPDPMSIEELSRYFPQLEIIELLGRGGMGVVYKARQRHLDRLVALKILPTDVIAGPSFAERFTREAKALAHLSHPHIVAIYDFGRAYAPGSDPNSPSTPPLYYLLMEYIDGSNLRGLIKSLAPEQALAIVPQICEALQFAHEEGIVHRDIKPENILVDKKGRVKIADFGLAKLLLNAKGTTDYTLTRPDGILGTLNYMAPEQLERPTEVDHRADIYSLGVVFYELLTGHLPLGRFALPSETPAVDARLDEVVLKALEREPDKRYQHASEVKTSVENIWTPLAKMASEALPAEGSLGPSQFPFAIKLLALTSAAVWLLLMVGVFTRDVQVSDMFIAGASLGIILWVAIRLYSRQQIGQAQRRGLWPDAGDAPTLDHVRRLAQAGEMILAIKLYRRMHPASLAEARAIVEKMIASAGVPPNNAGPAAGNAPQPPAPRRAPLKNVSPALFSAGHEGWRFYLFALAAFALGWLLTAALWNLGLLGICIAGIAMTAAAAFFCRKLLSNRPELAAARIASPRSWRILRCTAMAPVFFLVGYLFLVIGVAGSWDDHRVMDKSLAGLFEKGQPNGDSRGALKQFQQEHPAELVADTRDMTLDSRMYFSPESWFEEDNRWHPFMHPFSAHSLHPATMAPRFLGGSSVVYATIWPLAFPPEFLHPSILLFNYPIMLLVGAMLVGMSLVKWNQAKGVTRSWKMLWGPGLKLTVIFLAALFLIDLALPWFISIAHGIFVHETIDWHSESIAWDGPADRLDDVLDQWCADHGYRIAAQLNADVMDSRRLPAAKTYVGYQAAVLWNPNVFKRWHMTWLGPRIMTPEVFVSAVDNPLHTRITLALPQQRADSSDGARWNAIQADLKQFIQKHYPSDQQSRFYLLGLMAREKLQQGEDQKAADLAKEYLAIAEQYANGWNYGNAIHDGNEILGLAALKAKGPQSIEAAKAYLLAAGKTPGSWQLNTHGPDMELADQLLQLNQRQAVIDYFNACNLFWDGGHQRVGNLISDIKMGLTPRLAQAAPAPEQNAIALIGRWVQEMPTGGQKNNLTRTMGIIMQFDAGGTVNTSLGFSSKGTYSAQNGGLSITEIDTDAKGGKDQTTTTYTVRGDELVLHKVAGILLSIATPAGEVVVHRVSPARPGEAEITGQWLGVVHSAELKGDVTFDIEFNNDQTCRTTISIWPINPRYQVIGYNALIWGPLQSVEHHATFSVAGDQLTIEGFQYGEAETNAPIHLHRVAAIPLVLSLPPTTAATTHPSTTGN